MGLEIERKFLVTGDYKRSVYKSEEIIQGYLSSNPQRTVRVRIKGDKAYLTIKGLSSGSGLTRFEWEKEIGVDEAKELIALCEPGMIDKVRHYIHCGGKIFEVDEFRGDNEGLIIAEIELTDEGEAFGKPDWLGKEVTGDKRYYNSYLAAIPYSKWVKV